MELTAIFDVVAAVAVVLGIVFGLLQLRHFHLSRNREAAILLINSFQTEAFVWGLWVVQELPPGLTKHEIDEKLGEDISKLYLVMSTWERIGLLLFNHEISIDLVEEVYSCSIIFSWQKLDTYVADLRKQLQRETTFEWFQWLAERMMEREEAQRITPAYLAHRGWK